MMSDSRKKITGVVLAGGLARRMGGGDKGLIDCAGRPLISYSLAAIAPVVDDILINANRNQDQYRAFGYPVVADTSESFDGPLAGVLSAMGCSDADYLLTVPCDCPLIDPAILRRMVDALDQEPADCLVADDGDRMHPVVLLLSRGLRDDLAAYLDEGERKIDRWFMRHRWRAVDFSDRPGVFRNINTPQELEDLERELPDNGDVAC